MKLNIYFFFCHHSFIYKKVWFGKWTHKFFPLLFNSSPPLLSPRFQPGILPFLQKIFSQIDGSQGREAQSPPLLLTRHCQWPGTHRHESCWGGHDQQVGDSVQHGIHDGRSLNRGTRTQLQDGGKSLRNIRIGVVDESRLVDGAKFCFHWGPI